MILAEISHWSVVFYLNGDGDGMTLLRQIFDAGRSAKITVGSVGVFPLAWKKGAGSDALVHVDFCSCTVTEAKKALRDASVPLKRIRFRRMSRPDWEGWENGAEHKPKPPKGDGLFHGI